MNKIASASCFALLIAFLPCTLLAQWQELPGPSAGAVNDICVIDGTNGAEMYAATPDGVYRTVDSAKKWELVGLKGHDVLKVTQYITGGAVSLLAIVNDDSPDGSSPIWNLCRSDDSAKTWDTIYVEASWSGYADDQGIVNAVQDGNDIVICIPSEGAGDTASGIYRSSDVGQHWSHQAPVPIPGGTLPDFTIGGGSIFAIADDTLWTMPSKGTLWEPTTYPFWHRPQSINVFGNNLFVGGNGRIDISTDNGINWLNPPNVGLDTTGNPGDNISTFAVSGLTIVAASSFGVYLSTDGASSWRTIVGTGGYPLATTANTINFSDSHFYAATKVGIITSGDGINWSYATDGIIGGALQLASNGSTLFASTSRGIFRSTDHGRTWIDPVGPHDLLDSLPPYMQSIQNLVFAINPGLWRWDDSEWDMLSNQTITSVTEDSAALFITAETDGVLRSLNNGATWTNVDNGLPLDSEGVQSVLAEQGLLLAITGQGSVYLSNDEGDSWNWQSSNQSTGGWPALFVANRIYIANEGSGKIFLSSDTGSSWVNMTIPPTNYARGIDGIWSFGPGIAFSRIDGVYAIDANGTPTLIFHDSILGYNATGFASDDSLVYIAERLGHVYAEPLTSLPLAVSTEPIQPPRAQLEVFPNPSSGSGTFSFTLPARDNVSLKLFDERGVCVATCFEGFEGPGTAQVPFDASQLAAGTYIAVLSTREGPAVARIVLVPR